MHTKPDCCPFPFVICVISCILLSSGSQSASTSTTPLTEDNYSSDKSILFTNSSKGGIATSTSTVSVTLETAKRDNKNNDVDNPEDGLATLKANDMTTHLIQGVQEDRVNEADSDDNNEDEIIEEDEETEDESEEDDEKGEKLHSKSSVFTLSSISVEPLTSTVPSSTSSSPLATSKLSSVMLGMSQSTTSTSQSSSRTSRPSTPSTLSSMKMGVYQPSASSQSSLNPPFSTTSTSSSTQPLTPKPTTKPIQPTSARFPSNTHSTTTKATPTTTTTPMTTSTPTATSQRTMTTTPKMSAFLLEPPASLAGQKKKKKKTEQKKGLGQVKGSKRKGKRKKSASRDTKKPARKNKGKQNQVSPTPLKGDVTDAAEAEAGKKTHPNTRKSSYKKQGPQGPPGSQGPRGPPGPKGDPGPAGSNCSCPDIESGPPLRLQAAVSAVLTKHFGPDKDVIVPFDLELIDLADNYDNASGVFFCSIPGTYVVSVYLMSHPGSKVNARVMVNSRPVAALWADDNKGGGFYPSSSIQTISRLEFGDQVYVMLVDGGYGESWVHANYNVFTVFLLYEDSFM